MSSLDRYVSKLDMSAKRKSSGLNGSKRQGEDDRCFRGFTRVDGTPSNITFGHNAQRTPDANRTKSVEGGASVKTSMSTGGSNEYYKTTGSEGLSGSKGSW